MLAFGPVPSRRLGRSIGVNHIPPKACPYACAYCQVGRTNPMTLNRQAFYSVGEVVADVAARMQEATQAGEAVDVVTFVPDGEPTLDIHLGEMIAAVSAMGVRTAAICNGALIWRQDVRDELVLADWVSLKVDSVDELTWRKIDRPHGRLDLGCILEGGLAFAQQFQGTLVTETMLSRGINDDAAHLEAVANHLAQLQPSVAYLAAPTRPPAEGWVQPPTEEALETAYHLLRERVPRVEYLISYEGNDFATSEDAAQGLLNITAVHPMRQDAVEVYIVRAEADWSLVETLVEQGALRRSVYQGETYYARRLRNA